MTVERDPFGAETKHSYDPFSRKIATTLPKCGNAPPAQSNYEYNCLNQCIKEVDPCGGITTLDYNVRGQVCAKTYPDGSSEKTLYNLNGTVNKVTHSRGTITEYTYDSLRHCILETTFDSTGRELQRTTREYLGNLLIAESDGEGSPIEYTYDFAGRKASERKGKELTSYEYDSMGRLCTTKLWQDAKSFRAEIDTFDVLGRPVGKRVEDHRGTIEEIETYEYDIQGNCIQVCSSIDEKNSTIRENRFNSKGDLILSIDPLGNETHYEYDWNFKNRHGQLVLLTKITDPLGRITENEHDSLGRVVQTHVKDPQGAIVRSQTDCYDACGKKISSTYGLNGEYKIKWEYNTAGQLLALVESNQPDQSKRTEYGYNQESLLKTIEKPSGVTINHAYDPLGRLIHLYSSDGTVDHQFEYDNHGNVVKATDCTHDYSVERFYDCHDQLIEEHSHTLISYCYDPLGRVVEVTLPDQSRITYKYNPCHLERVERHSWLGLVSYAHTYQEWDGRGRVTNEKLINGNVASYTWDLCGRILEITTPHWSEKIPQGGYNEVGHLLRVEVKDYGTLNCSFLYDALDQLISETSSFKQIFSYDPLENPLQVNGQKWDVNGLNQVLKGGSTRYAYDADGNCTSEEGQSGKVNYSYDALGHLIKASKEGEWSVSYRYDPFGRRYHREAFEKGKANEQYSLFQGDIEIGSLDNQGSLTELRILGSGKGTDFGCAVALELGKKTFVPIYNHRGDLCCLIENAFLGAKEYIRYSAFGKQTSYNLLGWAQKSSLAPWTFSNKRQDPLTQLTHFGHRDFSPSLARWLTPDPLSFADGPNLYAYCHNSPHLHFDRNGLFTEHFDDEDFYYQTRIHSNMGAGMVQSCVDFTWNLATHLGSYCSDAFRGDPNINWREKGILPDLWNYSNPYYAKVPAPAETFPAYNGEGTITGAPGFLAGEILGSLIPIEAALTVPSTLFRMGGRALAASTKTAGCSTAIVLSHGLHVPNKPIWTANKYSKLNSTQNAFKHWKGHGHDFPELFNAKEYVEGTRSFLRNPPPGTLSKVRQNNDLVLYNPATNTFAIFNDIGVPKTMYKPNIDKHPYPSNLEYFHGQK